MDGQEGARSAYVELNESHQYCEMDDLELNRRMIYWKLERDVSVRSGRNMEEVQKIVLRLALEVSERKAEDRAACNDAAPHGRPLSDAA